MVNCIPILNMPFYIYVYIEYSILDKAPKHYTNTSNKHAKPQILDKNQKYKTRVATNIRLA